MCPVTTCGKILYNEKDSRMQFIAVITWLENSVQKKVFVGRMLNN